MTANYPAYFRDVSHLQSIDVYRVLQAFEVHHPALQHALKKVLAAGKRGAKDDAKDVQEAIDSLVRWQVMREEDDAVRPAPVADCQNTDGAHLYRDKFDVLRRAADVPEAMTPFPPLPKIEGYDASDFVVGGTD